MDAMAIAARSGPLVARCNRDSVNTGLIAGYESGVRADLLAYIRIIQMAFQTVFGQFCFIESRTLTGWRIDIMRSMAVEAGRRFCYPRSQSFSMSRSLKFPA
jgi:hypothetical protein